MGETCYGVGTTLLVTDEKALYTGSTWGQAVGAGVRVGYPVLLGPAGRRNVRCCVITDYACLLARSVLRTSVAGSGLLPKHRLIS